MTDRKAFVFESPEYVVTESHGRLQIEYFCFDLVKNSSSFLNFLDWKCNDSLRQSLNDLIKSHPKVLKIDA